METPNKYMKQALMEAEKALINFDVPVGAVIVDIKTGKIISKAYNEVEKSQNPLFHAEIMAINKACEVKKNKFLTDCDMYVTLEPCAMCAGAIYLSRIRRLYFGAYDVKAGGVEHGSRVLYSNNINHKVEIYGGILEKKSSEMLKSFFESLRNK